jgi:hypothetical protein
MFPILIVQLPQPDILDAGCFISHHPVKWKQMAVIIKPVANKKTLPYPLPFKGSGSSHETRHHPDPKT